MSHLDWTELGGRLSQTYSSSFPATPGTMQPLFHGVSDAFATKLSLDGKSLLWSTFLGGAKEDIVWDMALGASNRIVVAGDTKSDDFPTTPGALDSQYNSGAVGFGPSGFLTELSPATGAALYSSYLDGAVTESLAITELRSVTLDSHGRIGAAGLSSSHSLPFPPTALKPTTGVGDPFVFIFAADWSAIEAGTFYGDNQGGNAAQEILIEDSGAIVLCGHAYTSLAPTTPGAWGSAKPNTRDITVARFSPKADMVLYSTWLGAAVGSDDSLWRALLGANGDVWLLGSAGNGSGTPTTPGAYDTTWNGEGFPGWGDVLLSVMQLQPVGVESFGTSTPACSGAIRSTAVGAAQAGNSAFAIACTGAPAGAIGAFALGGVGAPGGVPIAGIQVYLDVAAAYSLFPSIATSEGFGLKPLPIPGSAVGVTACVQSVWLDTGGCGGTLALSASDALAITIGAP